MRNSSSMSPPIPSVPERDGVLEAGRAGVADGVVHVRPRVVGDGPAQRPVEVHAMGEQPCIRCDAVEPGAGRRVDAILGYVDVDAHPEIGRQPGDRLEARLGERETGMRTDKSPPPARRKRSFSARPARTPSGPLRSVTS